MYSTNKHTKRNIHSDMEFKIKFSGMVGEDIQSVKGKSIVIRPSSGKKSISSSDVKFQTIMTNRFGKRSSDNVRQLLALHKSGDYLAYSIKIEKDSSSSGALRVAHLGQNDRILIKEPKGIPQQVSFAITMFPIMVACIDERGDIFINEVVPKSDSNFMHYIPRVHITQDEDCSMYPAHLLRWCPYSPEVDEENDTTEDLSRLFLAARKNKVEIYDVVTVSAYGRDEITPGELTEGYTCIYPSTYFVTDMTMSPDGTTLAVTTNAGNVMFYQIQFRESTCFTSSCLHEWWPHEGKVLTCLLFLDNHGEPETSSFWKFVVTGAQKNCELKVWSCETWTCLQHIKFISPQRNVLLCLEAFMDPSTNSILLSDIANCKLYLMEIVKEKKVASIFRVSEFLLSSPILSINILDTGVRYYNRNHLSPDHLYYRPEDVKAKSNEEIECCTVTESYVVLPESLSFCKITYNRRPLIENPEAGANEYNNATEEIMRDQDKNDRALAKLELMKVNGDRKKQCQQQLMTDEHEEKLLSSGSSSPSREVEEIFSWNKAGHTNQLVTEEGSWNMLATFNKTESLIIPIPLSPEIYAKSPAITQKQTKKNINGPIEDESIALIIKEDNNDTNITLLIDLADRQNKMEAMMQSIEKKLDDALKPNGKSEKIAKLIEISVANAIKSSLLNNNMKHMIKNEIERNFIPVVRSEIGNIIKDIQESTLQYTLSDHSREETVNTIIHSINKVLTDVNSLSGVLTPIFSAYLSDEFSRIFIPKLDSIFHNMFKQLNHTLYKGVELIISNIENSIITNIKDELEKGTRIQTQSNQIMLQANETLEGVKRVICSTQETMRKLEEMSNQLSDIPKNVLTPVPIVQFTELSLMELINSGDITTAIKKVLNSADEKLLSLLVNKLPVGKVFHKQHNLKQNHILSLIYQLASDLSSETDGRCRYLERAMTYVDPDHPSSKQHLLMVMSYTKAKINSFLGTNPSRHFIQRLRLLLIVVDGLLAKKK